MRRQRTVRTQVPISYALRMLDRHKPVKACRLALRYGWNSHAWAFALWHGGARCQRGVWTR